MACDELGPEALEVLRRSLCMAPSLPAAQALRLISEVLRLQGVLAERSCCRPEDQRAT